MAYVLQPEELQKLLQAKGQIVSTSGLCTAENQGIAYHCSFTPYEGTLVDFEVNEETNELHSITLQGKDGLHVVCLDVKNSDYVWNIQQMVFLGTEKREKLLDIKAE